MYEDFDLVDEINEAYSAGKEDGYDIGYNAGYKDGYDDGRFDSE